MVNGTARVLRTSEQVNKMNPQWKDRA